MLSSNGKSDIKPHHDSDEITSEIELGIPVVTSVTPIDPRFDIADFTSEVAFFVSENDFRDFFPVDTDLVIDAVLPAEDDVLATEAFPFERFEVEAVETTLLGLGRVAVGARPSMLLQSSCHGASFPAFLTLAKNMRRRRPASVAVR